MPVNDEEFLRHLRATFRVEADEHLQVIVDGLMQLERTPGRVEGEILEAVFRAAHSLKGAARAVELRDVEGVCQSLEETFAEWKRQQRAPDAGAFDALHKGLDRVRQLLENDTAPRRPQPPPLSTLPFIARPPDGIESRATIDPPRAATGAVPAEGEPAPLLADAAVARATVRVPVQVLDERVVEAEELLGVKLAASRHTQALRELAEQVRAGDDAAVLHARVADLARAAEAEQEAVARQVDELLANTKRLLLLPFVTISGAFPKLVRGLARELGKDAELTIQGEQVEVDKRILDAIKDPLVHLLRNSVDHGVESPDERARRGKPPRAKLRLAVEQLAGRRVQVTLEDDGAGIDTDAVRATAVRNGIVSAAEASQLGGEAANSLVFRSGLSTSRLLTQVSGRGLGLAIVQERAERLGGHVSVESRRGEGTTFRIVVPALRATFRGILVGCESRLFVLPTLQVERVALALPAQVRTVEGRDTISLGDRVIPLVSLARALELPLRGAATAATGVPVVVLGRGDRQVAFAVDELHDEDEFLVKPLRPPLVHVRNVASATVLPTGQLALILDVEDLLRSARRPDAAAPRARPAGGAPEPKSILVAEDSITSRMLIRNILESGGFRVTTARDGMEAHALLRGQRFDLVVSDVEMPRLNGFDLTARIRADATLAHLPVVLVTAMERREDRERGMDVGASAYVVKSSFDESTLLDAVRRLVG